VLPQGKKLREIISWNRVPVKKLVFAHLIKKFTAYFGTQYYISVLAKARY
jgi:hypothetical protein